MHGLAHPAQLLIVFRAARLGAGTGPAARLTSQQVPQPTLKPELALIRSTFVDGYRRQPRRQATVAAEAFQVRKGGQKHLLHHVLDLVAGPAQEPPGQARHRDLVLPHDLVEDGLIARLELRHQVRIVARSDRDHLPAPGNARTARHGY